MIQGGFGGDHKNFEEVVPVGGHLEHWWHDNSDVNKPWQPGSQQIAYRGRSEKVCQLTGNVDAEQRMYTTNLSGVRANVNQYGSAVMTRYDPVLGVYKNLFQLNRRFTYTGALNTENIAGAPAADPRGTYIYRPGCRVCGCAGVRVGRSAVPGGAGHRPPPRKAPSARRNQLVPGIQACSEEPLQVQPWIRWPLV